MDPLKVLDGQVVSSSPLQETQQALASMDIRALDIVSHLEPPSMIWTGSTAHHSYSQSDFIFPLLDAPPEIRSCIYKHAVASKQRINITISKNRRVLLGIRRPYFNHCVSIGNINLLLTSNQVHDECIDALWSHNHFFSHHSASIQKLTSIISEHNTNLIQSMELDIDFHMRTQPNQQWPRKLHFFCTEMPNLKRFKLVSTFDPDTLMVEAPGDSRTGQEVRALISFGAFLVKRHPRLELMYWPVDSGDKVQYSSKVRAYFDLVAFPLARTRLEPVIRSLSDEDEMITKVEDMRLNSTAIRRVAWNNPQLCVDFPKGFEIDPASSVNDPEPEPGRYTTRDCAIIDQAAYLTPAMYHRLANKILAKCPRTAKIYETAEANVKKREEAEARAEKERLEAAEKARETQDDGGHVNKWQVPQATNHGGHATSNGRGRGGIFGNRTNTINTGEGSSAGSIYRGGRGRGGENRGNHHPQNATGSVGGPNGVARVVWGRGRGRDDGGRGGRARNVHGDWRGGRGRGASL